MSKRITIDLAPGYDRLLSITAIGAKWLGDIYAVTCGINTEKTTWLSIGEDGKVIEHGTEKPKEDAHG